MKRWNPIINDNDFDLFRRIAKHGYVDMDYIQRFCYREKKLRTIQERLRQLREFKYLASTETFIPAGYRTSNRKGYQIFALDKNAIELLEYTGIHADNNSKVIVNSAPYRMYHQVQVATVCDTIEEHYHTSSLFTVEQIANEKEAYDSEIQMQPDAAILFRQTDYGVLVFVEIERSYSSENRIEKKLMQYYMAIQNGTYRQFFKLPLVEQRLLFVSQTVDQYESLLKKIQLCDYSKKMNILITNYQDITHRPLEPIYISPSNPEKQVKLLSKLDES